MACPLCNAPAKRLSWLGALRFDGREYQYVECLSCRSLYADPMPDDEALARMYGTSYESEAGGGGEVDDPKDRNFVLTFLSDRRPGTFIDYGCGDGSLLAQVAPTPWHAIGVEFGAHVAARVAERLKIEVYDHTSVESLSDSIADVLHLGDVIEHLRTPATELHRVSRLLKPGGYLLAQGPLEANANLFTAALKAWRRTSRRTVSDMAPYHVMLATKAGQTALFDRVGLISRSFTVREVAWPAPDQLRGVHVKSPRLVALFALRRLSQSVSALRSSHWGNRYFYVGQAP